MIADALTKRKAPYNCSTSEGNRLGVYNMPSCKTQEGVLCFHLPYINNILSRYYVMASLPIKFMYVSNNDLIN